MKQSLLHKHVYNVLDRRVRKLGILNRVLDLKEVKSIFGTNFRITRKMTNKILKELQECGLIKRKGRNKIKII